MLPVISRGNICYQPTFHGSNVYMQSVLLLLFSKLFSLTWAYAITEKVQGLFNVVDPKRDEIRVNLFSDIISMFVIVFRPI